MDIFGICCYASARLFAANLALIIDENVSNKFISSITKNNY